MLRNWESPWVSSYIKKIANQCYSQLKHRHLSLEQSEYIKKEEMPLE